MQDRELFFVIPTYRISVIKGSIELWPTLVEICYFQKDCKGLPQTKVNNLPR